MSKIGERKRAVFLGAISVVILASEVTLTRLFNVVLWYHFGFLILSTALLGFGLGGLAIRLLRSRLARWNPDRALARSVAACGPLAVLALGVLSLARFDPEQVHRSALELAKLALTTAALVPPFVVLGAAVLYVLQRGAPNVSGLYAANLVGSGLGCVVAILALNALGGRTAFLALAAAMPWIAAWYSGASSPRDSVGALVLGGLLLLLVPYGDSVFPLTNPSGKQFTCQDPESIVFGDWTAVAKVDICRDERLHATGYGLWGLSPANTAPLPGRLAAIIDSWAYTTVIEHRETPGYDDFYESIPVYLAYRWTDRPRVLIIGSGGGMDIRGALHNGAREVDAVEINPSIFRAMHEDLAAYSGNVYTRPGVTGHLAEGRSFVESTDKRYDVIQLSGVDTLSATQAGAFALSESFLYTKEAVRSYLRRLDDGGVLTLTRWYLPDRDGRPRNSLRLFTLAAESLASLGVEDPGRHIALLRSGMFTVVLIKRQPIPSGDLAALDREMLAKGYRYLYAPHRSPPTPTPFYEYLRAPDRKAWIAAYPYNVAPPTDDSPFFFEHRKISRIFPFGAFVTEHGMDGLTILAVLFVEMLAAGIVLLMLSRRLQSEGSRPVGWLYFAAIGVGFMLVEVSLSQRLVLFLGHPSYALSVVLFGVLVFSGLGSLGSARIARRVPTRWLLLAVAAQMVLWFAYGTPLLRAWISWPLALRMLASVLLIAPSALLMGTAFPEAVRRLTRGGEKELGIYWAWNGVGSVLASVAAVIVAMAVGFGAVMLLAGACYGVAGMILPHLSPADDAVPVAAPRASSSAACPS